MSIEFGKTVAEQSRLLSADVERVLKLHEDHWADNVIGKAAIAMQTMQIRLTLQIIELANTAATELKDDPKLIEEFEKVATRSYASVVEAQKLRLINIQADLNAKSQAMH